MSERMYRLSLARVKQLREMGYPFELAMAHARSEAMSNFRIFRVTRELTPDECPWLEGHFGTIKRNTLVYRCTMPTYGACGPTGMSVSFTPDGDYPFCEVPLDALDPLEHKEVAS